MHRHVTVRRCHGRKLVHESRERLSQRVCSFTAYKCAAKASVSRHPSWQLVSARSTARSSRQPWIPKQETRRDS